MTWREFQLKLMGYQRVHKDRWYQTRLIAYQIYLNTPIKGKHVSINKFMSIDEDHKSVISDDALLSLREAQKLAMVEALNQTL